MASYLSETKIKALKPKEKPYKKFDAYGLYLEVRPSGKKIWRIKCQVNKKQKTITIGEYPILSLARARKKVLEIREKLQEEGIISKSFKEVAKEFLSLKKAEWSNQHFVTQKAKLENYVFEIIGNKQVDKIDKQDINLILDNVVKKKISNSKIGPKVELRRKIFLLVRQILRYAVNKGYLKFNVCYNIDINEIVPSTEVNHIQAILDEKEFKNLVQALFQLEGIFPTVKWALEFLILTALRSGNVRHIQWSWLDEEKRIIIIPPEEMKTRQQFRLPLTERLFDIIKKAKRIRKSKYIFYSPSHYNRPLSENVFLVLLKRLGITNHKPHGFRSSFSTFCYEKQQEHGFSYEVIETQLAHSIGNKVTRAYLRSDFLEERRKLLEWWEEFLIQK